MFLPELPETRRIVVLTWVQMKRSAQRPTRPSTDEVRVDAAKTSGCLFHNGNCAGERHAELFGRPGSSCGGYDPRGGGYSPADGCGEPAVSQRIFHANAGGRWFAEGRAGGVEG